ncbi:MAG: T9SS type A sorting domain-containing protein [Bacteroidetes bacterium]|nr:T9SS type A sorting domain-containing protein [Bacteroidota bacterium]MBT7491593.1 T9SS type A sorting domain-containing protein [Bacteroidota bacterium]
MILKNVILSDNSSSNLYNSNSIGVNGGGIMATNSNFIVNNVSIINNEAGKYGGGLYSNNSKFEINNSIIQNNISQYVGGIFIENSDSFSISNTRIFENLGLLGIGGVTVNNANLKMTNVEIVANIGNSNCSGAGISYSNIDFTNCLFTNNEGHNNSCGLYISYSEGHLINNTIANNFNYNHEPAVVFNSAGVTVLNSIIYENFVLDTIINPTNPIHYDIEGDANMAYSAIGYLNQQNNIFSQGNIQTDPYFVNPIQTIPYTSYQNLNYELLWNSPCIDAGIDFYVYNGDTILDLDSSEYLGSAPDMGYYEYKFKPSALIDIGVTKLDYPTEINCGLLSNESIILSIRNFGSQAFSNFYIYFSISQNPIDSILVNNTILSNTELEIQISNNFDFSTPGAYEIVAWTEFQNDTINTNDSLFTSIFSGTKIDKFPYFTDFENDNGYWKKGSEQSSWECGQPNGLFINSATSGTNVWATNLANYCYFENSFVESPCFDFTNLLHPTIEFNYWIEVYLNDGVALQSSIDDGASWQYVGAIGDTGNWYNITCSGLDLFGANIGAWNASGYLYDWLNASHLLEYLSGEPIVKFRFVISTSLTSLYYYYDGFAFDDFSIYDLDLSYVAANDLQKQFILHQNKPNPFVETTEISFYIPKQTEVEISIYNILGEKIQTLVSKTYSIGEHSIKFNSKNYNPGTYFYKMTCPDFVDTKNMIILE